MKTTRSSNLAATVRTTALLGGLTGLLVVIGALIGGPDTALLFLGIALVMNLGVYWFSDKIALKSAGAKPLSESEAPRIYEMVRELTTSAKMPTNAPTTDRPERRARLDLSRHRQERRDAVWAGTA